MSVASRAGAWASAGTAVLSGAHGKGTGGGAARGEGRRSAMAETLIMWGSKGPKGAAWENMDVEVGGRKERKRTNNEGGGRQGN